MASVSLYSFSRYCTERYLPFAFYRMPQGKTIHVVAQHDGVMLDEAQAGKGDSGFLFSPFIETKFARQIFINADVKGTGTKLPALGFEKNSMVRPWRVEPRDKAPKSTSRKQFMRHVAAIQKRIKAGKMTKAVAVRVIKRDKPADFDAVHLFKSLCREYPHALVSLVYTPLYGIWIGATPEVLLKANSAGFTTWSLAGTKENTAHNRTKPWGEKEVEEQKIVSDYIIEVLRPMHAKPPRISGPKTIAAGNLLHRLTTFTYPGFSVADWKKVAKALHPTPAVAGWPRSEAMKFIARHEKASRGFYSGFLGPVSARQVDLFVNLRCMQVRKNKIILYAGCGITAASVPKKEWDETEWKLQTILKLL